MWLSICDHLAAQWNYLETWQGQRGYAPEIQIELLSEASDLAFLILPLSSRRGPWTGSLKPVPWDTGDVHFRWV